MLPQLIAWKSLVCRYKNKSFAYSTFIRAVDEHLSRSSNSVHSSVVKMRVWKRLNPTAHLFCFALKMQMFKSMRILHWSWRYVMPEPKQLRDCLELIQERSKFDVRSDKPQEVRNQRGTRSQESMSWGIHKVSSYETHWDNQLELL